MGLSRRALRRSWATPGPACPGSGRPSWRRAAGPGVPRAVPPPGPAARLSSGGEAAAENGCSAEPAESCHGGGGRRGRGAALPVSPPPGEPRGRRRGARPEVPQGGGTGAEPAVPDVWPHLRRAGSAGQPRSRRARIAGNVPAAPARCPPRQRRLRTQGGDAEGRPLIPRSPTRRTSTAAPAAPGFAFGLK